MITPKSSTTQTSWSEFYTSRLEAQKTYPTEWVVRTLAGGHYPNMKLDKSQYASAKILDLSCGDGRNLRLLEDLGFSTYATEISNKIVSGLDVSKATNGWKTQFFCGTNTSLPFKDGYFDYILSCAGFYYMDNNAEFDSTLREISRVMKNGAYFIANIPDENNFIVEGARHLNDGSIIIQKDPYNLRNGSRIMISRSEAELKKLLTPYFCNIKTGHLADNYFDLMVSCYLFVCQKGASDAR